MSNRDETAAALQDGAPQPSRFETQRLASLHSYQVLDTPAAPSFDRITRVASRLFDTPTVLVSLVDKDRQWFKSKVGIDAPELDRETSFCTHALPSRDKLVVPNACEDERFKNNPLVTQEPFIRFYAGVPLWNSDGYPLGTLCIIDNKPRPELTGEALAPLDDLSAIVLQELERHRYFTRQLAAHEHERGLLANRLETVARTSPLALVTVDRFGRVTGWSERAEQIFGWSAEEAMHGVPPFAAQRAVGCHPCAA